MLDAKISEDRALHYLRNDWVRSDGQVITDVDTVVEKFVISPPPVTENVNDHPGEPPESRSPRRTRPSRSSC
ncbi:hypothetical protein [Pseudonocardia sp. T1-2H]|uniref:hypothetical protein n=1 Tax=Pseudonocardia sp. T1-2H TaxID=3128899 RepID=UPI003100C14B